VPSTNSWKESPRFSSAFMTQRLTPGNPFITTNFIKLQVSN
jgi:hypothetical protein